MKFSIIKTFVYGAFLLTSLRLKAQSGDYVITVKGDTLKCEINTRDLFAPNGKYKTAAMKKPRNIKPDEIKEFFTAGDSLTKRAVYKSDDASPEFMTVLEKGEINLYLRISTNWVANSSRDLTFSSSTELYTNKSNDALKRLHYSEFGTLQFKSRKNRMEVLAQLIADKKQSYDKFMADDKFGPKQIRNIIHFYNAGKPYLEIISPPKKDDVSGDFNPSKK